MDSNNLIFLALFFVILFGFIKNTFVVQENQRLVVLRMGKLEKVVGPGLSFTAPAMDLAFVIELSKFLPDWQKMTEEDIVKKITYLVKQNPDPKAFV